MSRLAVTLTALVTLLATATAGPGPRPATEIEPGAEAAPIPAAGATSFVTREGAQLRLDGERYRFAGPNIYWLGLDENVGGVDYPTYFRIRDALQTARGMGATAVRSHTLGASTGHPLSVEPALDEFNDDAFATIDYAVAEARRLGLRLVVPLTDNWAYYHGGRADFTAWYGLPPEAFYTDARPIGAFKRYIDHVLAHVNPYTGKAYRSDPTIMAWELGNELNGMTADWIRDISGHLKVEAPHQLVAAGAQSGINPATLDAPAVDIVDVHYYPPSADRVAADATTVTDAGKAYLAGEFGSTSAEPAVLQPVAADERVSGATYWSLFAHNDTHGYVPHNDGFTLHYPGDTAVMRAHADALTEMALTMNARGGDAPRARLGQPVLTSVAKRGGENLLAWRGTAIAAGYLVQRSTGDADGPWTTISDGPVTDNETPWMDLRSPARAWYRLVPVDARGRVGPASDPAYVGGRDELFVDPLESWRGTQSHSEALRIVPDGEHARVVSGGPRGGERPQITWYRARTTGFDVHVTSATPRIDLRLLTSRDGETWTAVPAKVRQSGRDAYVLSIADLTGVAAVRVEWTSASPAVTRAVVRSDSAEPPDLPAPGPFTQSAPADGARGVNPRPEFAWTPSDGAAYYTLVVSRNADLSDPVLSRTGLQATTFRPSAELALDTTYHWQVSATNVAGETRAANAPTAFTTGRPITPLVVESFEEYDSDADLRAAYLPNPNGDPVTLTLDRTHTDGSANAMGFGYALGANGYAGVSRTFAAPQDWWGYEGLRFWLQPGGGDHSLTIQFVAHGLYWEHSLTPTGTEPRLVEIPFEDFATPPWAEPGTLDLTAVSQLSVYAGGAAGGTDYLDSVTAYPGE